MSHWVTLEDGRHVLIENDGLSSNYTVSGMDSRKKEYSTPVYYSGQIQGIEATDTKLQKVADNLNAATNREDIKVMQYGEGSLKRTAISVPRIENTLSGGRKQSTDIEINVMSPKKGMGRITTYTSESQGINVNDSTNKMQRDFTSYTELESEIKKLLNTM